MAKFNLAAPFEGVSGKLDKDDNLVFSQRYGATYAWEVEKSKKDPTMAQLAQQERFAQAASKAADDMLDLDIAYICIYYCNIGHLICIVESAVGQSQEVFNDSICIIVAFVLQFQGEVAYYIQKFSDIRRPEFIQQWSHIVVGLSDHRFIHLISQCPDDELAQFHISLPVFLESFRTAVLRAGPRKILGERLSLRKHILHIS